MNALPFILLGLFFFAGDDTPSAAPAPGPGPGASGGGGSGSGGGGASPGGGGAGPTGESPAPKSGPAAAPARMFSAQKAADWWGTFATDNGMVAEGAPLLGELAWATLLLANLYIDVLRKTKRPEDATLNAGALIEWTTLSEALQVGLDGLEASPGNAASTARVVATFQDSVRLANALSTRLDAATRSWAQGEVFDTASDPTWSIPPSGLLKFARDLGGSFFTDAASAVASGWHT